jgi:hypothetical protein
MQYVLCSADGYTFDQSITCLIFLIYFGERNYKVSKTSISVLIEYSIDTMYNYIEVLGSFVMCKSIRATVSVFF